MQIHDGLLRGSPVCSLARHSVSLVTRKRAWMPVGYECLIPLDPWAGPVNSGFGVGLVGGWQLGRASIDRASRYAASVDVPRKNWGSINSTSFSSGRQRAE
jgi:hypothetical protein